MHRTLTKKYQLMKQQCKLFVPEIMCYFKKVSHLGLFLVEP